MKWTRTPHEHDFRALALFNPDANEVFIDIGSNRGEAITSMLIFDRFKNKIIGFEPNALIFSKLKNYLKRNQRIVLHNCGLGDSNEESPLFVPFYRKWMFDGLSSFNYANAKNWLVDKLWCFNEKKLQIKELICHINKLDDFKLNPYFVKIDVQGYELQVLKGATGTIASHQPILLIESLDGPMEKFLRKYEYGFYHYSEGQLIEGRGELNTYCITDKKYNGLNLD